MQGTRNCPGPRLFFIAEGVEMDNVSKKPALRLATKDMHEYVEHDVASHGMHTRGMLDLIEKTTDRSPSPNYQGGERGVARTSDDETVRESELSNRRLVEKFFLLRFEDVRTKERFIFFMHNRNAYWKSAMAKLLIKNSFALCKAKFQFHLFPRRKRQYSERLDDLLEAFLTNELQHNGDAGMMHKRELLRAISDFDLRLRD